MVLTVGTKSEEKKRHSSEVNSQIMLPQENANGGYIVKIKSGLLGLIST